MCCCAAETAFAAVVCNGLVKAPCGGLRVILLVRLCMRVKVVRKSRVFGTILKASVSVLASSSGSFSCCRWTDAAFSKASPASFPTQHQHSGGISKLQDTMSQQKLSAYPSFASGTHLLRLRTGRLLPHLSRVLTRYAMGFPLQYIHLSCRPPKKLKPPEAFCRDCSACCAP